MRRPLVPEDRSRGRGGGVYLQRAAYAHALAALGRGPAEDVAARNWPGDSVVPMILRGVVAPATTTSATWAGDLARQSVGDFIASLAPISAAAAVFARAVTVSLDGVSTVMLPRRTTPPANGDVPWVEEGKPVPVGQLSVSGSAVLGPARKLAVMVALTRETLERSAAEAIVTQILRENAALSLDASLFSTTAASASRPAGILNGIAGLTATAGGGEGAFLGDVNQLAAAIADHAGDTVLVMNPSRATFLRAWKPDLALTVLATRAVAATTIVALDPAALAVGFGLVPRFEASTESVIHLVDSDATGIGVEAGGSPATAVAAPARSLFQTDCVVVKCTLPAAWTLRAPAVAWLTGATW